MAAVVLIVGDNDITRAGMAVLFPPKGYEVLPFPDGRSALEYLRAALLPDVILLDMIIAPPGGDGLADDLDSEGPLG